jgi:uncharacterized membrane protein YhhN
MLPWILLCAAACAALLIAERLDSPIGVWLCKPLASAAFVAAALAEGAAHSTYGRLVLLGLCLSWLGDVLLIPRERHAAFLAGIASFLLAHVAFGAAFAARGIAPAALALAGALTAAAALRILRWLRPHLTDLFRWAVPAYTIVIAGMVTLGVSAAVSAGAGAIGAGALLFAVSDVFVARDRLVAADFANALWGLPLYFGAQLLLASTVAALASGGG